MRSFRRARTGAAPATPSAHDDLPASRRVVLRHLGYADRDEFLAMVEASRDLHRPWAYPPHRPDQFDELVARCGHDDSLCLLAATYVAVQFLLGLHRRAFVLFLLATAAAEPVVLWDAATLEDFASRVLILQAVTAAGTLVVAALTRRDPQAGAEPVL